MYKKGAGNDKQGKDAENRTLCPYRNFSQAIRPLYGQRTKKGLGTINKEKTREIERFARMEILVRQ